MSGSIPSEFGASSNLKVFREIYGKGCFYFDCENYKSILQKIYYFSSLKEKEIKKKIEFNYQKTKKLNWEYCGNNYYQIVNNTSWILFE